MKILLVQPAKPETAVGGEDFAIYEPLALEYLAAAVARDHDIRILDIRLEPDLDGALSAFQPDVVGLTAYTVHVNTVKRLGRHIKAVGPAILTVVGGHHATILPEDFADPGIDLVVAGEGVVPFREVISRREKRLPLAGMPGAVPLATGGLLLRQVEHALDLDTLPFPRRECTATYRSAYFSEWMRPLASLRTSKGCLFKCQFCALWKITGGRYLTRRPERVLEELGTIAEPYVFFADDESLLDTERMGTLADLIRRAGLQKRFFLYGRSDTIANHPRLLEQWKEAGLERVFVGLEFMHDADLKWIRKGSTVDNNVRAVQVLQGLDIDIFPMFIVRPDFGRAEFADLRQQCRALALDFVGFSVLTPLPGTELHTEVKDQLLTANYDYFDFLHTLLPTALPLGEFYRELRTLYTRSRSLPSQLRLLRKYRLRDWPSLVRAYGRFLRRLQTLPRDYPAPSECRVESG
jgi:radical SAM superfamily enzyme YgiQ (UPF0313 family)